MNSVVVPLHRCGRCGSLEPNPVDIDFRGEPAGTFWACDACLEKTRTEMDAVRPIFDTMIECGVQRDIANDTMTFLLDRMHPTTGD